MKPMTIGTMGLAPGWHEGKPMSDYLGDPAVSASTLWKLHSETPAHLLHELQTKSDDSSDAKNLGSLTHTRVFEPEEFDRRYVVLGQCEATVKKTGERCTSQGSIYRDGSSYCGVQGHDPYGKGHPQDPSIETVTEAQRQDAIGMDGSLKAHHTARTILEAPGPREVVGVCQDPATGLYLRIRPDELIGDPIETPERYHHANVNLKTTGKVNLHLDPFRREFERMGHHFKAAFYRHVIRELWDVEPQNFLYVSVEASKPYPVRVFRLHEDWIDEAEVQVIAALTTLARCIETEHWPGYGIEVCDLNMPEWRLRQIHRLDELELDVA